MDPEGQTHAVGRPVGTRATDMYKMQVIYTQEMKFSLRLTAVPSELPNLPTSRATEPFSRSPACLTALFSHLFFLPSWPHRISQRLLSEQLYLHLFYSFNTPYTICFPIKSIIFVGRFGTIHKSTLTSDRTAGSRGRKDHPHYWHQVQV